MSRKDTHTLSTTHVLSKQGGLQSQVLKYIIPIIKIY